MAKQQATRLAPPGRPDPGERGATSPAVPGPGGPAGCVEGSGPAPVAADALPSAERAAAALGSAAPPAPARVADHGDPAPAVPPPAIELPDFTLPEIAPLTLIPHDRWVLAAHLARRLARAAWSMGAFTTATATLAVPGHEPIRPAVAVIPGDAPIDPVITVPPLLVIELAPRCDPVRWLARGAGAVWSIGRDAAVMTTPDGTTQVVRAPGTLRYKPPTGRRPGPRNGFVLAIPVPLMAPGGTGRIG